MKLNTLVLMRSLRGAEALALLALTETTVETLISEAGVVAVERLGRLLPEQAFTVGLEEQAATMARNRPLAPPPLVEEAVGRRRRTERMAHGAKSE